MCSQIPYTRSLPLIVISSPPEVIEQRMREWFDRIFRQRDLSAIEEMVHPEAVLIAEGKNHVGRKEIGERLQIVLAAFDPIRLTIEEMHISGNSVSVFWHVQKTHVNDFLGIAPTNRQVSIRGTSHVKFEYGLMIEGRDHWDVQDLIDQLTTPQDESRPTESASVNLPARRAIQSPHPVQNCVEG